MHGTKPGMRICTENCHPYPKSFKPDALKLAGHIFKDISSSAHLTVTWEPVHDTVLHGKPTNTFVDTLLRDAGISSSAEQGRCMVDR